MQSGSHYVGSWGDIDIIFARPTGTWANQIPAVNTSKCCQCGWCYIFCPTGSIVDKGRYFEPDLNYCKGCGICARECPISAIKMVER